MSGKINGVEKIPIEYQQDDETVKNSCVWLAACLVIRSVDENLATILLAKYRKEPTQFGWLRIFKKKSENCKTLYKYFQWTTECYLAVYRVRIPKEYKTLTTTNYILNVKKEGLIVAILRDTLGNASHTIGINLQRQLIYDCEEEFVMKFSQDNLSVCCGPDMIFDSFYLVAESKYSDVT